MKVVLVSAPGLRRLEIYQSIGVRAPPLGLAYIAAVLEQGGHKVSIIDAPTLGLTTGETVAEILSLKPDVVGISAVTPTVKGAYRIVRKIKQQSPETTVVMGGPHVSFMYEEAINKGVDYVAIGEGEYTMKELLEALEDGIREPVHVKGLAYRSRQGNIKLTPPRPLIKNLDKIPWPARHLLPMDKYTLFEKPIQIIHMMASRGCPYGCIYCTTSYFWGRRYRVRSVEDVVDELENAVDRYKTNIVVFSDDELTLNRKWVYALVDEIKSRGLDITFTCGSRVSSITPEMLEKLKSVGCTTIYYGIESYKDEDIEKIGKRIKISQAVDAIRWTREAGIEAAGSFILGFPWQTVEDMKNTVKFAKKLNVDYAQFTVATPYPGTPLYNMARKEGLIEIYDWDYYTTLYPVMRGYHFTREQVARIISWAYRSFYLRPTFILTQMRKGRLGVIWDVAIRAIKGYIKSALSKRREEEEIEEEGTLEAVEQAPTPRTRAS